jgi:hypothetical protein
MARAAPREDRSRVAASSSPVTSATGARQRADERACDDGSATRVRGIDENRPGAGEEHERRRAVTSRARESSGLGVGGHEKPAKCERAFRASARMRERATPPRLRRFARSVRAPAKSTSGAARVHLARARESSGCGVARHGKTGEVRTRVPLCRHRRPHAAARTRRAVATTRVCKNASGRRRRVRAAPRGLNSRTGIARARRRRAAFTFPTGIVSGH